MKGEKRFKEWMQLRGGFFKNLEMKYYTDGEPYYSYGGAELSLKEFLSQEDELQNILPSPTNNTENMVK